MHGTRGMHVVVALSNGGAVGSAFDPPPHGHVIA
jgi:hypothetical protein